MFAFLAPLFVVASQFPNLVERKKSLARLSNAIGLLFQVNDDEQDQHETKTCVNSGEIHPLPNLFTLDAVRARALQRQLREQVAQGLEENFSQTKLVSEILRTYNIL